MFRIKQANFVTSVGLGGEYPQDGGIQIAMAGRSNVGKSSLINSLCGNNKLARISQTPGKTRLINFFRVNNDFYLVDLPGYGFASAPMSEKRKWGELIENYLASAHLTHIFLLLDIRHMPTQDDVQMFKYILYNAIPYTIIATKSDKIARSKRINAAAAVAKALGAPPYAIVYSSASGEGREELLERIGGVIEA